MVETFSCGTSSEEHSSLGDYSSPLDGDSDATSSGYTSDSDQIDRNRLRELLAAQSSTSSLQTQQQSLQSPILLSPDWIITGL